MDSVKDFSDCGRSRRVSEELGLSSVGLTRLTVIFSLLYKRSLRLLTPPCHILSYTFTSVSPNNLNSNQLTLNKIWI